MIALLGCSAPLVAQQKAVPTLRSVLLKQFQNTWNKEEWFVPVSVIYIRKLAGNWDAAKGVK